MGLGQRAPATPHRIEDRVGQYRRQALGKQRVDLALGMLHPLLEQGFDRQCAERQADPSLADPVVERLRHLQAAAAHVADEAHRTKKARNDAERGVARLFGAAEDADVEPAFRRDGGGELRPVRRSSHRLGGDGVEAGDPHGIGDGPEAPHRLDRAAEVFRLDGARLRQPIAETAQRLLVEARHGRAAELVVDHDTDGIGADVDDPVRRAHGAPGRIRAQIEWPEDGFAWLGRGHSDAASPARPSRGLATRLYVARGLLQAGDGGREPAVLRLIART
jgi:hypothetical protein